MTAPDEQDEEQFDAMWLDQFERDLEWAWLTDE